MKRIFAVCLAASCGVLALSTARADYSGDPQAPKLLQQLKSDYGFDAAQLQQVRLALAEAKRLPQLVEQEQKAPEKTETWTAYSRRIDASRIQRGAAVLEEYAPWFARAEEEYGVPPAIIAGILGIETRYGRITGSVRVLDALATQGFDHPTRSRFFFDELLQFFVLCRDNDLAPDQPRGSYAGAMGAAQFMPSNYRRLAVDFDGDGDRDLWSIPDAIGSIAHYLTRYRPAQAWRRGEPVLVRAHLSAAKLAAGAKVNTRHPTYRAGDLAALGIAADAELPASTPVGIIELPLDDGGREYWIGFSNFYAVMTYNPRTFYGMAVSRLAQEISAAFDAGRAEPDA